MKVRKIVVDSGIIAEHLVTETSPSLLRKLAREYFCYTTVFNAIELFSAARSENEIQAIDNAMAAMKVLGLNSKSAKNMAEHFLQSKEVLTGLIAGVCIESKLPLVTPVPNCYKKFKSLEIIPSSTLKRKR